MNAIGWGLAAATVLAGIGVFAAVAAPGRVRAAATGVCTAGIGVCGVVAGVAALGGAGLRVWLPWLLPLAGVRLSVDPLGGLFLAVAGAVVATAAVYGIGYVGGGHGPRGRGAQASLPLFGWALLLVPCADSISTFLVTWELVALTSLLLVLAEHQRRLRVAEAGLWYAAMTHLGLVAILVGLATFGAATGGESFDALRSGHLSPITQGLIFVLVFAGCGSKAGLVPLHVWLPRAHPEAPSHVSMMLSAAMVNLGVYGVLRFGVDLLGGGSRWWWLLVLGAGAVSALYGILQAAVATDLKRLLAYSTVENMGLVFVGVGASGVLRTSGAPGLAALAMAAALLHVVNHAGFKALLFGAAGSVLRATGSRDLDALGGLRSRMPVTTALFALGALGAAALPSGNGFVSEWLLLQSLVHAVPSGGVTTALVMPAAVAVVALTAGLSVATFVKAVGVGFFARPRSDSAATASESPRVMVAMMGVLAVGCVGLAVAPGALGPALTRAVDTATPVAGGQLSGGVTVRLAGITSTLSPLLIIVAVLAAVLIVAATARLASRGVRRRRAAALWDCGAGPPTARMEYTATSFAEPLQRVFDDVLAPETDVDVTPYAESRYIVERVRYHGRIPDRIEHQLYRPVMVAARIIGRGGRMLANGSVHRYLGYGYLGVVSLLVALAVIQ